jgi:hypothetical protein
MTTKSTGNSKKHTQFAGSNGARFLDLSLSSTEEKALKEAKIPRTSWANAYNEMLGQGLKVTLKTDARTSSIMLMIQDADYDPDVPPDIYVMRAGTAEGALLKAAWYWASADGTLPDPDAAKENAATDDDIFA